MSFGNPLTITDLMSCRVFKNCFRFLLDLLFPLIYNGQKVDYVNQSLCLLLILLQEGTHATVKLLCTSMLHIHSVLRPCTSGVSPPYFAVGEVFRIDSSGFWLILSLVELFERECNCQHLFKFSLDISCFTLSQGRTFIGN